MNMRFLAIPVLILITSCRPVVHEALGSQPKTLEQYWTETGLTYQNAQDIVMSDCETSSKEFIACTQAVNAAASFLIPRQTLLPLSVDLGSEQGELKQTFGPLGLYEFKPSSGTELSPIAQWKKTQEIRNKIISALTQLFDSQASREVHFQALFEFLRSRMTQADGGESHRAATVINIYLSSRMDPHTYIAPKQKFLDDLESPSQNFAGIGAVLKPIGHSIVILELIENSPAQRSGLLPGDEVLEVDHTPIQNMNLADVVSKVRGPEGSIVTLTIKRKNQELSFPITRAKIEIPHVSLKILNDTQAPLAYLKLTTFESKQTCDDLKKALATLAQKDVRGLIFDLRSNGGGLLDQATCIGGLFLGRVLITSIKSLKNPDEAEALESDQDQVTQIPMVTLINAGSASASEIVAGALQDYHRSWIAGQRSFGKGSVQAPKRFVMGEPESILFFQTIARFYQPSGRTNQVVGIIPDFTLDPRPQATEEDLFAIREADLYTNALPPQGPEWKQPFPEQVERIQDCIRTQGTALKTYDEISPISSHHDFQLLLAEDTLNCSLSHPVLGSFSGSGTRLSSLR